MKSFKSYLFREAYKEAHKLGDRLAKIEPLIDWEAFRPLITPLHDNKDHKGGRPNLDEVMMMKLLVLQQWYGLSDPELERQAADRLSFRRFLGFPEKAPDYSTVWQFRERLASTGKDRELWEELQRQMDEKGLKVRKGVAQDATFITADPGQSAKPREWRPGPGGAGTVTGPGEGGTPCSATSSTPSRIRTSASSGTGRRPRPLCTTVRWTSLGPGR